MTNYERLEKAKELINEIRSVLNTNKSSCSCCERVIYENFQDHSLDDRLKGICTKINKIQNEFIRKSEASPSKSKAYLNNSDLSGWALKHLK